MNKKHVFLTLSIVIFALPLIAQVDSTGTVSDDKPNMSNITMFVSALLGCAMQEFIYWFELKNDIAKGNIPDELNSKAYWLILAIALIIFPASTYLYFTTFESNPNFFTVAVFAAGFPRLFKGAVQQLGNTDLAADRSERSVASPQKFRLQDYLMIKNK